MQINVKSIIVMYKYIILVNKNRRITVNTTIPHHCLDHSLKTEHVKKILVILFFF